jgi:DNA-binding transcriptional ArsR family regulator
VKPLASELLGTSRAAILAALLLRPELELHARELARVTGVSIGTLLRELRTLHALGLVKRREVGRQVFFSAESTSPVFDDLASLLRKTVGLGDRLREALLPLAERMTIGFVYGSMAAGTAGPHSDVDVMVIGDVSFSDVTRALHPAQLTLGREINPTVMSAAEFKSRRRARDGFVQAVIKGPKIWLYGGEDEFAELVKDRPTASARGAGR